MQKIISNLVIVIFLILISLIATLSTIGIETNRFNDLITKKINQNNNSFNLKLTTIKFKLDIKNISLFLETVNPKINYKDIIIPAKILKFILILHYLQNKNQKLKKLFLN